MKCFDLGLMPSSIRVVGFGLSKAVCLPVLALLLTAAAARAQPDYPPALWNQAYPGHWYTTGFSHSFCIIHDMEGYYLSTISYFQHSTTKAGVHYFVNGKKDYSSDAPGGEVSQGVREAP